MTCVAHAPPLTLRGTFPCKRLKEFQFHMLEVLGYLEKSVRALEAAQVGMHDPIFPKLGGIIEDMFFHNSVNFWQNRTPVV